MTYVLVHGAGMDSRCWDRLLSHLDADAIAVDLPGRGRQSHTDVASASIEDFASALIEDVEAADLQDIVLVAHSFAGVTVPRVLERLAPRLAHVVFLSAVVPEDGSAVIDQIDPAVREAVLASVENGVYHQSEDGIRFMLCNDLDEEQSAWTVGLVADESAAVLMEEVDLSGLAVDVPRTYVACSNDTCYPPELQGPSSERVGGQVRTLDSGHMSMVSRPEELAALLGSLG